MSEHRCKHCAKQFVRPLKWERTYEKDGPWVPICGRCASRLDRLKYDGFLGSMMLGDCGLREVKKEKGLASNDTNP